MRTWTEPFPFVKCCENCGQSFTTRKWMDALCVRCLPIIRWSDHT